MSQPKIDTSLTYRLQTSPYVPIMLGAMVFFLIIGVKILDPTNIAWLKHGDPAQHWLGWQFFRNTPLFQWPLGAIPNYGMELSSTIVFTDSIPLLAFIFKPFQLFLPENFQYFGFWLLLCFILQSYFSWKILSLFTQNPILPLIGSLFFTLAPIYLFRLFGHYALVAHWELLAGLFLYFSNQYSLKKWMLILCIGSLTHAYMLLMILSLFSADLLQRYFLRHLTIRNMLFSLVSSAAVLILVMWGTGYFVQGGSVSLGGYGLYKMNLLAPIDGDYTWSKLLPDISGGKGDAEGFNYLGLGIIILFIIALYTLLINFKIPSKEKFFPLLVISIGLFLFAISNQVSYAENTVLSYPIPLIIDKVFNIFRASGRFFWPVYYLIYLFIFYLLYKNLKSQTIISLGLIMLLIQIFDSSRAYTLFSHKFNHTYPHHSELKSPLWNDFAQAYEKIVYVLPKDKAMELLPLFRYAAANRMTTNMGIYARTDIKKQNQIKRQISSAIAANDFASDSLYVFADKQLWQTAIAQLGKENLAVEIDQYKVLAPNYSSCAECNPSPLKNIALGKFLTYQQISFAGNKDSQSYLLAGWSGIEPWGVWSEGYSSSLKLDIPALHSKDIKLLIVGRAFLSYSHPLLELDLLVNKRFVKNLVITPETNREIEILVPSRLIAEHNGEMTLQFNYKNPTSPFEQQVGSDKRILGLGLISLKIELQKAP